jgi:hypothetical protein
MQSIEGEIHIHPQFPLTIKHNTYWDECPICLEDEKTIEKCIMLSCGHRFCSNCISKQTKCCICDVPIPAKEDIIFLNFNYSNDELWINCDNIKYMYDISYLIWRIFGCIDKINLLPIYNIANNYDEAQKYRGSRLNILSIYVIRGWDKKKFIENYVDKIIMALVDSHSKIKEKSLFDFMKTRFELDRTDILGNFEQIKKWGYLETTNGMLKRI